MNKAVVSVMYEVEVMFGDCDPAGIVFFPNFSKWMDASSLNFFVKCGVPTWRDLVKTTGIIGTPLLEINTKFMRPATAPASMNSCCRSGSVSFFTKHISLMYRQRFRSEKMMKERAGCRTPSNTCSVVARGMLLK